MSVFYNDNDAHCCRWLTNLTAAGHLPAGTIDSRSITDLTGPDLSPYSQCHLFAGIGGWPLALSLAGWPSSRPVWTGSCPCQPFSCVGKGAGTSDPRHLWPDFRRLIAECRPPTVFGEQVASKAGRLWLAGVRADLEALGYAVGAADLCAAGLGAPHIRQRLYWVANSLGTDVSKRSEAQRQAQSIWGSQDGGMGNPDDPRLEGRGLCGSRRTDQFSAWSASATVHCADGKTRRISTEPGAFPLAHGIPGRVGLLRGYGNAIVPQVAATFISAFMETL